MSFLGIDLSLSNTGVVIVEKGKIVKMGNVKTKPPKEKNPSEEARRLIKIISSIDPYIDDDVELVCIEGLSFMSRNTTALVQLSGLNYMLREKLLEKGKPFVIAVPTQLKKFICGSGRADKDVMMLETFKRYNVSLTDNNVCDAFGLALIAEAVWNEKNGTPQDLAKYQSEVYSLIVNQLK